MNRDAFSRCHPAVNFIFFIGAIGAAAVIWHPVYLLAGLLAALSYYVLLRGVKAWRSLALMLPFGLLVAGVNPIFNIRGQTVLFMLLGRPYTLQALIYGAVVAGILLLMLMWFGCYNAVMTGDKFSSLFGNLIPSISLLLVMVFRMVPNLLRKTAQILGARRSVGKGAEGKEGLRDSTNVLSAMTSWALEDSLVTADSMRSRGYGSAKRTSFQIYRMTARDWVLLSLELVLLALVILGGMLGQLSAEFLPAYQAAPPSWGLAAYSCYLLIPVVLHLWEAIRHRLSLRKL